MAIFNTSKKKKAVKKSEKATPVSVPVGMNVNVSEQGFSSVLLRPHITEKASMLAEKNTYVFEIHPKANKKEVAMAVANVYKVTPARVHIINLPAKKVFSRGRKGMQSGLKKAVVYLKHGDKIEFV
ncbi:MAG: 50S ribosomal protein L23 [Candidatus Yonathbacteria bacterium]|nr:50S ribosomal protein L23 [Candidatus Yonathbacteria bacterium]